MTSADVSAQSTTRWKGSDYNDAVGKTVFLYNVGTGRFIVHGGDWGTQVRLFNEDYGKSMTPTLSDGRYILKTGVNTGKAAVLGCNVPEITSIHAWKGNNDQETFTLIMDANENYSGTNGVSGQRNWHFVPVDAGDGTYTYYMYEELGGGTTTNFYYITFTSGSTTYYLTVTNNSAVGVTTDQSKAQRWTTANADGISYTSNGTTYSLKRNGSEAYVAQTGGTNAYYYSKYGIYTVTSNYNRYYLKYESGEVAFETDANGNRFTRSSQQSETTGGTKYWLGAAYGENGPENAASGEGHEGDPVGKLCLLASGYDKAVWSTADPRTDTEYPCQLKGSETAYLNYDNATNKTVNRSMQTAVRVFNNDTFVPLNDLYKWRIVTEEEFMATLNMTDFGDGLSTNLTWMITDRGFERSDNTFFDGNIGWKTGRVSGVTYGSNGRYGQTWGFVSQGSNQQGRTYNGEPWNAPVRLKTEWVHKENAKYGFMEFEGAGTASTYITAPVAGVYRISCYGFYQGTTDHPAYLFATTTNPQGTAPANTSSFITSNLEQVSGSPYRYNDKNSEGTAERNTSGGTTTYTGSGVMLAGATFVNDFPNRDKFYREVEIKVEAGDKIYLGVGKNGATQRQFSYSGYYYDQEYVGVDQFNIHYLGTDDPILFDEDKENWDYLPATPDNADTRYRTIRLKRTFKTDKWNSFVFPYGMTAVQVRRAFGDQTRVAELDGLGTITDPASAYNADVIDFKTIELPAEGVAIKANVFYLIKPSQALPAEKNYYDMGTQIYNKESLPQTIHTESYGIGEGALNAEGHNTIISKATYWATTNYDSFTNTNLGAVANGVYVPAKSYVISDSKMYYIKNANRIKGFRGWIEDVDATGGAKLALNGIIDENEISGIDDILTDEDVPMLTVGSAIYDLSGRKVAVDANQFGALPKGMYIVNGKKYIVK